MPGPRDKDQGRIRPLFPRYLFVQADRARGQLHAAAHQPGVARFLGYAPDRPTPVPLAALETLWGQCAPNGVIYPPKPPVRRVSLQPGTVVAISSGPFAGLTGVCRWSSAQRVAILLTMMGGEREVRLSLGDVRPG